MSHDIAEKFVDLVLKYEEWWEINQLPPHEMNVLQEFISAAGFVSCTLEHGILTGSFPSAVGCGAGSPHQINVLCPFKVVGQDGADKLFATGWLDTAVRYVVSEQLHAEKGLAGANRDEMVAKIAAEIERTFKPIQLTREGDFLCGFPPLPDFFETDFFVDHQQDTYILPTGYIGTHNRCGRKMRVSSYKTTVTGAVVCQCGFKVAVSARPQTYGDIRAARELRMAPAV